MDCSVDLIPAPSGKGLAVRLTTTVEPDVMGLYASALAIQLHELCTNEEARAERERVFSRVKGRLVNPRGAMLDMAESLASLVTYAISFQQTCGGTIFGDLSSNDGRMIAVALQAAAVYLKTPEWDKLAVEFEATCLIISLLV